MFSSVCSFLYFLSFRSFFLLACLLATWSVRRSEVERGRCGFWPDGWLDRLQDGQSSFGSCRSSFFFSVFSLLSFLAFLSFFLLACLLACLLVCLLACLLTTWGVRAQRSGTRPLRFRFPLILLCWMDTTHLGFSLGDYRNNFAFRFSVAQVFINSGTFSGPRFEGLLRYLEFHFYFGYRF